MLGDALGPEHLDLLLQLGAGVDVLLLQLVLHVVPHPIADHDL